MSQEESRGILPGHADFTLPEPPEPVKVNGRHPLPGFPEPPPAVPKRSEPADVWDERVARGLAFLRRRLAGTYEVDDFGYDPELAEGVFHPLLRLLYADWFRTELYGVEHVPASGPGLLVGNHSGTLALDALMLGTGVRE
jgi:hypothetical protein